MINLSVWNARSSYRFTTIDLGNGEGRENGEVTEAPSFGVTSVMRKVSWAGIGSDTQISSSSVSLDSSINGLQVTAQGTSTSYQIDSNLVLPTPISVQNTMAMSLEFGADGVSWSRRESSLTINPADPLGDSGPLMVVQQRTGSLNWGGDGIDLSTTFNRVSTSFGEPDLSITRVEDQINVSTGPDMGWSHRRLELNSNGQGDVAINRFARSYDGSTTTSLVSTQQLGLAIG